MRKHLLGLTGMLLVLLASTGCEGQSTPTTTATPPPPIAPTKTERRRELLGFDLGDTGKPAARPTTPTPRSAPPPTYSPKKTPPTRTPPMPRGLAKGEPAMTVPLSSIPIIKTVVRPSPYYTIDPAVKVKGYFYNFHVKSSHGEFAVVSVRKLIKLLREIEVIEKFKEQEKTSYALKGFSQAVSGVGRGFGNLVVHPGQSIKRVGQGTGRAFRAVGGLFTRPFREKKPTLASDGTDRAHYGNGPGGGERRLLAWELNLDVYTDNPKAKYLLKTVAQKRLMGKLPLNTAVFALPGGAVFTLSLTPMGFDPTTEEILRDNAPEELKRLLGLRYKQNFGLDYGKRGGLISSLLDNPNYSPREQAYLARYLHDMKDVQGVRDAISFLAKVKSPAQASMVSAQVELLSLLHARARPLAKFVPVRHTLGARAKDGTLCFVISIDTVRYWADVVTSLTASINAAKRTGARRIEIWSTGDIDRQSTALANRHGVTVHQNILDNPVFRRPRIDNRPAKKK